MLWERGSSTKSNNNYRWLLLVSLSLSLCVDLSNDRDLRKIRMVGTKIIKISEHFLIFWDLRFNPRFNTRFNPDHFFAHKCHWPWQKLIKKKCLCMHFYFILIHTKVSFFSCFQREYRKVRHFDGHNISNWYHFEGHNISKWCHSMRVQQITAFWGS